MALTKLYQDPIKETTKFASAEDARKQANAANAKRGQLPAAKRGQVGATGLHEKTKLNDPTSKLKKTSDKTRARKLYGKHLTKPAAEIVFKKGSSHIKPGNIR